MVRKRVHTAGGHLEAEEFHFRAKELTLSSVEDQPIVPELLQDAAKMDCMGEAVWTGHQDVIEINQDKRKAG